MADNNLPQKRSCATMRVHERLLRTDPGYAQARIASENRWWQARTLGAPPERVGITVIPTVVHVVWKSNDQNIDVAQIQSQIDVLNHDFRKTNSDISSIPSAFAPRAGDARVQCELASVDPQGNPTDGVTRTQTSTDSFSDDDAVKSSGSGGADAWPADRYLNLWVCALGAGLLGYAQFPGGPAATDGVVILHTAFGTSGTAAAPFNLGRSATHEIGHWLNLRHIWGDDGGGCNGDDFVADTPNAADHNFGKPTFPHVTCNNGPDGDMFMNYMDYTDDDSMFMFSQGQVDRMQTCLDGDRSTIGHAPALPTGPTAQGDDMQPGEVLNPDQAISSASGRYRFVYQGDGNLVLYDGGTPLWASNTDGTPAGVCIMQGDGNLVIYAASGQAVWDSGTWGHPGSRLVVQDDGNVVIYQTDGTGVWATNTWLPTGPPAQGDDMQPGEVLNPDQAISSASGRYRFVYQGDGNLVLYDGGTPLWASNTDGRAVGVCIMQGDGNLVIYARGGPVIWDSGTWGHPGSRLVVQDDGNVVIYQTDGTPVWATNTVQS